MFFMLGAEGTRGEYNAVRHASHPWYKGFNIIIPDKLIEMEKAKTVFPRDEIGLFMWDYQFKGFLKEMRHLRNLCSKGPGGPPDLFVSDQSYYELYEAALAAAHMNPSYQKADIPFDNVAFYGKPLTWDEYVPNASGGTRVQSTAAGTCWAWPTARRRSSWPCARPAWCWTRPTAVFA